MTLDSDAIPSGGLCLSQYDKPENKIYAIYKVNENVAGNYLMKMDRNIGGSWSNVWETNGGSWPSLSVNQETNNVMISYFNNALYGSDLFGGGNGQIDGNPAVGMYTF